MDNQAICGLHLLSDATSALVGIAACYLGAWQREKSEAGAGEWAVTLNDCWHN